MRRHITSIVTVLITIVLATAHATSLVYPPPPAPERLHYVGDISDNSAFTRPGNWLKKLVRTVTGKAPPATLSRPHGLAVGNDVLLVVDSDGGWVHRFALTDSTWSRIPSDGRLQSPVDAVACPGGLVFVSDAASAGVIAFDAEGHSVFSCEGPFERPAGLAYDASHDRLVVADAAAHRLVFIGLDGHRIGTVGRQGTDPGEFNFPVDVCVTDDGLIHVLDAMNYRIQTLDPTGDPRGEFGCQGDTPGCFARPRGLAVNSAGLVFVTDALQDHFQIFDRDGRLLLAVGSQGHGRGEFWMPAGIAIDRQDRIYVADAYNHRVQLFQGVALNEGDRP